METNVKTELKVLVPNPHRDFKVDPIDNAQVKVLQKSIEENPAGFWGGIVCRRQKGEIQIVFGHHRIEAAKKAGIESDDIKIIKDLPDADMIRMYATENATHRGNLGTAQAGNVAAAIRYLAREILTGGTEITSVDISRRSLETAKGQIATKGIGRDLIFEFLKKVPGVDQDSIRQQLLNLRTSGDYTRIINEVAQEIETDIETSEKAKKLAEETAKKAAEAAANQPVFDLAGVSKWLRAPDHIETFREAVLGKGIKPYLDITQQAALAHNLVKFAKDNNTEVTSRFIRENIMSLVLSVKRTEKQELTKEEKEELKRKDWSEKARTYQRDFAKHGRSLLASAIKLTEHAKDRPRGVTLDLTAEFRTAIENIEKAVALFRKAGVL